MRCLALALAASTLLCAGCSASSRLSPPLAAAPNSNAALDITQFKLSAPATTANLSILANASNGSKPLLYACSYLASSVEVLKEKGDNQQPIAEITSGINGASGLFVDRQRKLYVTNWFGDNISIYPHGSASPSEILTGAHNPDSVVVALDGTVYVANYSQGASLGPGSVMEYPKGEAMPKTIVQFKTNEYPTGLALDSQNNLFIAFQKNSKVGGVLELKEGKSKVENIRIQPLSGAAGLAVDRNDNLLVVNQDLVFGSGPSSAAIYIYRPGGHTPWKTILPPPADRARDFYNVALDRSGKEMWVSTVDHQILGMAYPGGAVIDEVDLEQEALSVGIAASPAGSD